MPQAPEPTFERDIKRLTKAYEGALKDVQAELNSLFLTDFKRAQIIASEKQIKAILSDIRTYGDEWSEQTMTHAAREGVAATIYALGATDTIAEARKLAQFNQANRRLIDASIADTQADLLAVTQNVERQAKIAIRKAVADATRYKLTQGSNATQEISREIRKRIVAATDVAIIDARGRRWKVATYADMIARTKALEAHREASINEALSEGSLYGRISRHGATDLCRNWESKIIKLSPDAPGNYPYVGDLPRSEIFHVNCRHIISPLRDPSKYEEN